MYFSQHDIQQFDDRYRALMINSLSGFKSANLIGTTDKDGNENLAIVSSVFHLGANPPLMGMIIRPNSVPRHTLENILQTQFYTINHVNTDIVTSAHQTSARYDKSQSEFDAVKLTSQYLNDFSAPYVQQSRVKIGLALRCVQTLEINKTELVVGEIIDVHIECDSICDDGFVDLEKMGTVAVSGLDSYHSTKPLGRLKYAKPFEPPQFIDLENQQPSD
ncbi:flavin reductase [Pseudoalteromonas sp. MMG013]|uniref:flavin reductase family protein n=1 Tax=Pseudoalteromonas sp. MMG013 TaxID=2822687 RepID=UPI001B390B40|nr:flavin reductase [Pseudoalteromonas sp. MMG013]MBQ4860164.1 flavin reductase [Pseudoalteromonas sp. MMG013]